MTGSRESAEVTEPTVAIDSPVATRGGGRATVYDVARLAGVSIKTVSRVVNASSEVVPATRDRVRAAMVELGYVRNPVAHALVTGSTATIGVVVDSIADHFFSSLVSVVEERALAHGMSVLIASTGRSPERERAQIERLIQQNVAALLVAPAAGDHSYVAAAGRPIVLVDNGWELPGFDTIRVQDREGSEAAVRHLIEHGHRRIAFLGEPTTVETVAARRAGYDDALAAQGLEFDSDLVSDSCGTPAAADDVTRRLLTGNRTPTAIFASNPRAAMGVVSALHALGRTDVALISFGDFDLAEWLVPAVTVVDHDPHQLAEAAATRLFDRMEHRDLPAAEVALPVKIVARGSGELRP